MHKGSYPRGFYGKDVTWLRTKVAELEDENGISDDSTTLEPSSDRRTSFYDTVKELRQSERVKATAQIPQLSTRVWVKYSDGIWAGAVRKVDY
eukprot:COSAG02_NODE_19060_length_902_cov_1.308842_1_plen_92_part_10